MTLPRRSIEAAHFRTLEARQAVAVADDPDKRTRSEGGVTPHKRLQEAVSLYYEGLRSYLVSTPEGKRYFTGEVPDKPGEQGYGVLRHQDREETKAVSDLPDPTDDVLNDEQFYETALAELVRDNELVLRPVTIDTTDDGEEIVRARIRSYQVGLRHLDELYNQRVEVEKEKPSGFMKGANSRGGFLRNGDDGRETYKQMKLLPLSVLMSAARELDRAATELDLLAETKESDMKPYMRGFDTSNGEAQGEVSKAELSGSPEMS